MRSREKIFHVDAGTLCAFHANIPVAMFPLSENQPEKPFLSLPSAQAFSASFPARAGTVHLGIGNFDGFHRGHRAIFSEAKKHATAEAGGGVVGALTFAPHPEKFFHGNDAVSLIFSRERKDALFVAAGLDFAVHEPFSKEFASIEAEDFVRHLLRFFPRLGGIYVGDNFRFGAKRRGDVGLLKKIGASGGVDVNVVEPVVYAGARISSTRIRDAISSGDIFAANEMLGSPYESCGEVVPGNQIGRTIGFPTLNLPWAPELRPRFGAYVVRVRVPATGKIFPGLANYGVRPTVERSAATPLPLLETFLMSVPAGTLPPTYGDKICVEWLKFLRPEMRFPDLAALQAQIARDKAAAGKTGAFPPPPPWAG